ncbi:uncharacterized protein LOC120282631 [Dioscorea cayenensis subsp. rotundata]|uniref:Uncharacterized protein LOC120282631 n=1 Tax=Dioscorea cayennensis subsp. rotundata TaxID=55577 RepID=A0AB40CZ92_DIOCR|nr:uncharacterized protein LOC120282631 [Dioscorea cayenensis subsp. rotundata]
MIQWYILNNCELVEPFFEKHKMELELQSTLFVEERHKKKFPLWFKKFVTSLRNQGLQEVSDGLFSLACGPDRRVRKYTGCIVNGVRFHTKERDFHLRSQNSGVMVEGMHEEKEIDFYGVLTDIIQLDYIKGCEVVMFKCNWYDVDGRKRRIHKEGNLVSINVNKCWYENDPFILAIQAKQVFYLDDIKLGKNWKVVQKFHHRHLYDIPEIEQIEVSEMFDMDDNIDQENEFEENDRTIHVDDFGRQSLHRDDVAPDVIDFDDASMENFGQQSQRGLIDIDEEELGCNDDDDVDDVDNVDDEDDDDSDVDPMFH